MSYCRIMLQITLYVFSSYSPSTGKVYTSIDVFGMCTVGNCVHIKLIVCSIYSAGKELPLYPNSLSHRSVVKCINTECSFCRLVRCPEHLNGKRWYLPANWRSFIWWSCDQWVSPCYAIECDRNFYWTLFCVFMSRVIECWISLRSTPYTNRCPDEGSSTPYFVMHSLQTFGFIKLRDTIFCRSVAALPADHCNYMCTLWFRTLTSVI
jgi:hypothetical protein